MVGAERQVARPMLDDREREPRGEFVECGDGGRIAPGAGGDDERVLRRGEDAGRFVEVWRGQGGEAATRRAGAS